MKCLPLPYFFSSLTQLDEERQANERMARVADHQKKIDREILERASAERDELRARLQACENDKLSLEQQLVAMQKELIVVGSILLEL